MKAEELRIGNLLYYKGSQYVANVQLISGNHFDCRDNDMGCFTPNGSYEPIPLTEEWLVKFGFAPCREGSTVLQKVIAYSDESYPCTLQVSGSGIQICRSGIGAICPNIEYVHQLQNLYFALTGEELEVNP